MDDVEMMTCIYCLVVIFMSTDGGWAANARNLHLCKNSPDKKHHAS